MPGLRGVAAIRLHHRLRRFTPRGGSPISVKPDLFAFAVVGRGRCREAVTERMPGIRPEQIGTSKHG
jgi:hypothetical protein